MKAPAPIQPPNPLRYIRKNVLGVTQTKLSEITGIAQSSIWRCENGEAVLDLTAMSRIRDYAKNNKIEFNDSWFFELPASVSPVPKTAAKKKAAK